MAGSPHHAEEFWQAEMQATPARSPACSVWRRSLSIGQIAGKGRRRDAICDRRDLGNSDCAPPGDPATASGQLTVSEKVILEIGVKTRKAHFRVSKLMSAVSAYLPFVPPRVKADLIAHEVLPESVSNEFR